MAQASRYGGTQRGTVDDEFQSFPDYESGRRAQRDLWKTKPYQDRTVRAAIKRWSPDATEVHVNEMLTAANASNGEKSMRDVSDAELNALMDVQQKWEGWIPPTATTPASRSYNNNNPGNIKRTDTMMQDPTSPTRPVNDGSPDTPSGNVNMVYAGTDKELLALFGKDGSEGARSVPLRQRDTAIGQGWMIESVPVEQTAESIEPINWRGHVSHAMERAGIDSPSNAFNTLWETLPTAGAIIGGGTGLGAVPGYAGGQGLRELGQNLPEIIPAISDVAGHTISGADSPGPFIQDRPDIDPAYSGVPGRDVAEVDAATDDPYAGRTFPSPRQAAWDAFQGGVMGDIVNLLPGARRGRQALQSLDEGNPYTASVQGVGAALDAASGFGGGAIAQTIKATPRWQNLLAAGGGGAGSAVAGELAGHVGEEWLDLTPDQQRAFEAYGELLGGGVVGGMIHPSSRQVMGDIVTPIGAGVGATLGAMNYMPGWAAAGPGTLAYIAAAAARRRTREARTVEGRAIRDESVTAERDRAKRENQLQDQERQDTIREQTWARADERAVVRDAQWDARGRERIAAAKTLAEAREAQQAHSRQAALDRTLRAENRAALVARGKLDLEAKRQEIKAKEIADARAERVDREQGRQEITDARRAENRAERDTNRTENRAERLANRTESRRIARENRQETLRIALDRAETADLHYAERRSDRIAAAETLAEIRREKLELDREIRADKNATNAKKEEIRKLIDETARARQAELSEGLEAGDPKVVVRSTVNDDGVQSTTTQTLRPKSKESGGDIGDPAGEILMRPGSEGPSGTTRQEPTSPASPSPDTPGLSEADAILVAEYDQKLGVSQSINLAEPLRKRYEELTTKKMRREPLSEAEFDELSGLRDRFTEAGSDIGLGFQVAGSPGNRTLPDPTIIDRSRAGSGSRRGRR